MERRPKKARGPWVRGVAILTVGILATGAFAITPATAGKFLTKRKALRLFYKKVDADTRFINVGEKATSASTADSATNATNANNLDGLDSTAFASVGHDHDTSYQQKYAQTIVVSPVGTSSENGTALLQAVSAITGNSSSNRFLVKVEPGTYHLGSEVLQMKPFVDIEGSGEGLTTVMRGGFAADGPGDATVVGAANAELRFLTVFSADIGADFATAVAVSTDTNLTHVRVLANSATSNVGVRILSGFPILRNVWVQVSAPDGGQAVGILSLRNPYLASSLVLANHSGGGSSQAIKVEAHDFNIDNSVLIGGTNSVVVGPTGTVRIGASRVEGATSISGTGTVKCAQSYNGAYDELGPTCT